MDFTGSPRKSVCFNEARAFPPGKCSLRPSPLPSGASASMRPGRFRLGSARPFRTRRRGLRGFNEARAFPPGKWRRRGAGGATGVCASMRPGRFRLGSGHGGVSAARWTSSFNEARAFPPGKCMQEPSQRPGVMGFNEARAFPPGKWASDGVRTMRRSGRFNEARAFPPGKCGLGWCPEPSRGQPASMRPGRFRLGSGGGIKRYTATVTHASMRPGRFRLGSVRGQYVRSVRPVELQ